MEYNILNYVNQEMNKDDYIIHLFLNYYYFNIIFLFINYLLLSKLDTVLFYSLADFLKSFSIFFIFFYILKLGFYSD